MYKYTISGATAQHRVEELFPLSLILSPIPIYAFSLNMKQA
jgi:hypothetical protein